MEKHATFGWGSLGGRGKVGRAKPDSTECGGGATAEINEELGQSKKNQLKAAENIEVL